MHFWTALGPELIRVYAYLAFLPLSLGRLRTVEWPYGRSCANGKVLAEERVIAAQGGLLAHYWQSVRGCGTQVR